MKISKILVSENVGWLIVGDLYSEIVYYQNSKTYDGWYQCCKDNKIIRSVHESFVVMVDYV